MVNTETNERAEYDEEDLEVQGSTSVRKTDGEDEGDEDEQSYLASFQCVRNDMTVEVRKAQGRSCC